ncbi:MAG: diguanylate cyclase response regulator [Candidatus Angelobacter sp. Gp1-AA117]|nr:MAG: diguanylate cyclase response regulator [Candidatus Angelobacter sp. Gp1-AA117]
MAKRVLIVEDDAVSRRLLHKLLEQWKYDVIELEDGAEALKILRSKDAPKLAIVDWMLPGLNGPDVVRQLRSFQAASYTYVLLLTSKSEKSDILQGLDSGADDYLTKPFDAQELRARLRVGERIVDLHERLTDALSASEFRASHDGLTGLYNRSMILNLLDREAARCERAATPLGVILADIDRFKAINDSHGHAAGDQVLLEVAGRMQSSLRSYDFLGRYGGEEFLIVAPDCSSEAIQEVAERVRQSVAKSPISVAGANLTVTISLGASLAPGSENLRALLKRTDLALYAAKRQGRNRSTFMPVPHDAHPAVTEPAHVPYQPFAM